MKKRIDLVEKYFYPVTAGIEVNMLETYSVLTKKGWDVHAHTSVDSLTEKNVFKKSESHRGIRIHRKPFGLFGFWPDIDWQHTDIVALHNFNIFPHFLIMLYTLFFKIIGKKHYALVITPHGGYNPEWRVFPFWQATIKRIYHFTVGALMINLSVDGVRAVSEWEKYWMIKRFIRPSIIRVIPNGIESEAYMDVDAKASKEIKDQVKSWGNYLVQIGRIYPIKNYETTIKALSLLSDTSIKFIIVGPVHEDDGYRQSLIQLAKGLKIEDRVIFTGVIKGFDKFYVIKHSLTMVHMAIWESFCNVVHEALSQGKVPIVADNTALPFLIQDNRNGYLVETKDSVALARKIEFLIGKLDSKKIKEMSQNNREEVKKNLWSNVAAGMDKFYNLLTSK